MTNIEFNGPFHFDNIDPKNGKIINNPCQLQHPNSRGIYIWGFVYECNDNGEILEAIDFNEENLEKYKKNGFKLLINWKFIPYYVGKKENNIYSRLKSHQNIRNGDASKYIRLSNVYMKTFFRDIDFSINLGRENLTTTLKKERQSPGSIEYFNSSSFLKLKYPGIVLTPHGRKGTDFPITLQINNGKPLQDCLNVLINNKNNFWFCFSVIADKNLKLSIYEAFTFWSLKGVTVSKSQKFRNISPDLLLFDATKCNIFKKNVLNELCPSDKFIGY